MYTTAQLQEELDDSLLVYNCVNAYVNTIMSVCVYILQTFLENPPMKATDTKIHQECQK